MKILGIDPGIKHTGWGIISCDNSGNYAQKIASGVINTSAEQKLPLRLASILNELQIILTQHQPNYAAIEETYVNNNAKSSLKLSHARGVIMAVIASFNINIAELSPRFIKKTVVGNGAADKEQIQHMIKILIKNCNYNSNDEADALAIAYSAAVMSKTLY